MVIRSTSDTDLDPGRAGVDPRLPIYLVTGEGGASKLALLERFANCDQRETPYAFVITDPSSWSAISAGGERILPTPEMVRISSGKVCCYGGDDPVHAFHQLHLRKLGLLSPSLDYDAVVVDVGAQFETGNFSAVVQNDTRLDVTYRIAGILHAVDAGGQSIRKDASRQRWIGEADTIVLTQTEECDADSLLAITTTVSSLNPLAAIEEIDTLQADSFHPWRIAPGDFNDYGAERLARETGMVQVSRPGEPISVTVSNLYGDARSNEPDGQAVGRAMRVHIPGEVDLSAVMRSIETLCISYGPDLLRLSAALNARHADHPVAIDVIGGTLLHPSYHSREPRTDSDISIVARGLDIPAAVREFRQCCWTSPSTAERMGAAL